MADALRLPIVSKFDPTGVFAAQSGLDNLASFAKTAGAIATAALAGISYAAFQVGKDSVFAASNFQEVGTAVEQIFGDASAQLQEFAKTAPDALGQTRTQFLNGVKTFGIFGKAAGLATKDNAAFSEQLTVLASDLASFNNTTVDDAIQALGAGLRGESEPLRRYGVLLDDATLKARAAEMGIYDGTGALSQQQRVLAAQAEILAQTTTQQGDFARTQDGMANGARTLKANFEDLQITIGQALLPVVENFLPIITDMIDAMAADPAFQQFIKDLADNFSILAENSANALPQLATFAKDSLPVLAELVPAVAEAFDLLAGSLGLTSDKAGAAGSTLQGLADFFNFIGDAIHNLNVLIDAFNYWLDETNINLLLIGNPLLGLEGNINAVSDALEIAIGLWDWFWGISQSKPIGRINFNTSGAGVGGLKLAEGGIVMPRPGGTMATIGEGGQAEAVIPLNRLGSIMGGGGGGAVYNINVSTLKADASVGEIIVNAIKKYERTSGAVFAGA